MVRNPACLLGALLACAAGALAQSPPEPNAIGVWRSDNRDFQYIHFANPPGPGVHVWQVLPAELLTYFRAQPLGGTRELDFRGVEFKVFYPTSGPHTIPQVEIRRAVEAPAPQQGRWVPDLSTPAYVTFPATPVTGALNAISHRKLMLPAGSGVAVPASSSAGDALCFRVVDYGAQYGGANSVRMVFTSRETGAPKQTLSGATLSGTDFWLDQLTYNSHELVVTWYFDQSLMQPIKNATISSAGSPMPGGGTVPVGPIAVYADDGRGALRPQAGETLSYSANSNFTGALPSQAGSVWIVPLVMFEGDLATIGTTNPQPENWVDNNGAPDLASIHPMPLQQWIDDLLLLFAAPAPGTGALLNPSNSTLGLWLGVDFAQGFVNPQILINAFTFASVSGGPAWAGPETLTYNTTQNPAGLLGRNLVNFGPWTGENRSYLKPQRGFTPVVAVSGNQLGFAQNPGGPAVQGLGFYVQSWILDVAALGGPLSAQIYDVTNVIRYTLGG
ncbi:MAG: hypothetical protein JNJ88_02540 [Planctomycetes bacterium]|nr:hypothetical protein [Planctomycetota bacterium]